VDDSVHTAYLLVIFFGTWIFNLKLVVFDLYFLGVCAQVGDPLPCGGFDLRLLVGYH
jgi:hypothetical protein